MIKLSSVLVLAAVVTWGEPAMAGKRAVLGPAAVVQFQVPAPEGPRLEAQPSPVYPPAPAPDAAGPQSVPVPSEAPAIELYSRVRYKDLDEKHPRAVPTVVSVPHPATGWKRNYFSPPPMVHVAICVPPKCGPPKVKYKSLFREYEFDFGKHSVDVRLRDGGSEVDYQD